MALDAVVDVFVARARLVCGDDDDARARVVVVVVMVVVVVVVGFGALARADVRRAGMARRGVTGFEFLSAVEDARRRRY